MRAVFFLLLYSSALKFTILHLKIDWCIMHVLNFAKQFCKIILKTMWWVHSNWKLTESLICFGSSIYLIAQDRWNHPTISRRRRVRNNRSRVGICRRKVFPLRSCYLCVANRPEAWYSALRQGTTKYCNSFVLLTNNGEFNEFEIPLTALCSWCKRALRLSVFAAGVVNTLYQQSSSSSLQSNIICNFCMR